MTSYTVQRGDTLGTIAAKFLGSSGRYKEIASANPQIKNLNVIEVGQKLSIPTPNTPALVTPQVSPSSLVLDQPTDSFMTKLLSNKKLLIALALGVGLLVYVKSKKRASVA